MSRGALLTFLLFIVLGLGLGLYLGWVVSPVEYVDAVPAALSPEYKDDYVLMTAEIFAREADLETARARLEPLGLGEPGPAVAAVTRRFIASGQPEADVRRLARLAAALGTLRPEMEPYLP